MTNVYDQVLVVKQVFQNIIISLPLSVWALALSSHIFACIRANTAVSKACTLRAPDTFTGG